MAQDGEAIYERFYLIKDNPLPSVPVVDVPQVKACCNDFFLSVLADTANDDPLRNDVSGFLWQLPPIATGATMTLIKGAAEISILSDDTYGTLYPFGFFTNVNGRPFVGYQLNWRKVLQLHGPGMYKVMVEVPLSIGSLTGTYYSPTYCLWQYTPAHADETVRIEYNQSGILGMNEFDFEVIDRGSLFWYNSYRLPGYFGYPKAEYDNSYVQYNSGSRQYVTSFQEPEYVLQTKMIPGFMLEIIRTEILQADRIAITDYNSQNIIGYVAKRVFSDSGFEPQYHEMQSKLASVRLTFKQEVNNLRKLRM